MPITELDVHAWRGAWTDVLQACLATRVTSDLTEALQADREARNRYERACEAAAQAGAQVPAFSAFYYWRVDTCLRAAFGDACIGPWLARWPHNQAAGRAWVTHRYFKLAFDGPNGWVIFESLKCALDREHSARLAATIELASPDPLFDEVWQPLASWLAWSLAEARKQPLLLDDPPPDPWDLSEEIRQDPGTVRVQFDPDPTAGGVVERIRALSPIVFPLVDLASAPAAPPSVISPAVGPSAEFAGLVEQERSHEIKEDMEEEIEEEAEENAPPEQNDDDIDGFYWDPISEWFPNWTRRVCLGQWSKWRFLIGYFNSSPVGQHLRCSRIVHARLRFRAVTTVDCVCGHSHRFVGALGCGCVRCQERDRHVVRRMYWFGVDQGLTRREMAVCSGKWCKRILRNQDTPPARCPACDDEIKLLPVWYRPWPQPNQAAGPDPVEAPLDLPATKAQVAQLLAQLLRWKSSVREFLDIELGRVRRRPTLRAKFAVIVAALPFPPRCDALPLHWEIEFRDGIRMPTPTAGAIARASACVTTMGGGAVNVTEAMFKTRKTYLGIGETTARGTRGGWVQWAKDHGVPDEPPYRP